MTYARLKSIIFRSILGGVEEVEGWAIPFPHLKMWKALLEILSLEAITTSYKVLINRRIYLKKLWCSGFSDFIVPYIPDSVTEISNNFF